MRSYSHEGTASAPLPLTGTTSQAPTDPSGFIFIQPATPPERLARHVPDTHLDGERTKSISFISDDAPAPVHGRHRRPRLPDFSTVSPSESDIKARDFAMVNGGSHASASGPSDSPSPSPAIGGPPKRPLHQKSRTDLRIEFDDLGDDSPFKTPMLRKKSGELVRSSLKHGESKKSKAKSAPATPLGPKYVHFDSHLEHVKHFLAQQRPTAVSRDGSPIETETEGEEEFPFPQMNEIGGVRGGRLVLNMPNFPAAPDLEGKTKNVYLRTLEVTDDSKSLRGVVQVKNLAFHKWVALRFTFDAWQTVSEVSAEYLEPVPGGQADRFVFNIKLHDMLARIEGKVMFLAARYTVDGREIWDNNGGPNYRIEFSIVKPKPVAPTSAPVSTADQKRPFKWSVTTAGQAQDRMAELRAELNRLVGDDFGVDVPAPTLKHSSAPRDDAPAGPIGAPAGGVFSARYDFGASLRHASGSKNSPRTSPTNTPRKQSLAFPSTFIGGMPATSQQPHAGSPLVRASDLPGFVGPYVSAAQRPPSPPDDADENVISTFPYAAKLAAQSHRPTARFSSFPPHRSGQHPAGLATLDHLALPDAGNGSPTSLSPSLSPQASPLGSPSIGTPPRRSSPPPSGRHPLHTGLPSPSPSESGPSSPESPPQDAHPHGRISPTYFHEGKLDMNRGGADVEHPTYGHFVQNVRAPTGISRDPLMSVRTTVLLGWCPRSHVRARRGRP